MHWFLLPCEYATHKQRQTRKYQASFQPASAVCDPAHDGDRDGHKPERERSDRLSVPTGEARGERDKSDGRGDRSALEFREGHGAQEESRYKLGSGPLFGFPYLPFKDHALITH